MPINWLNDCVMDDNGFLFCYEEESGIFCKVRVSKEVIEAEKIEDKVAKMLLLKHAQKQQLKQKAQSS